MRDRVVLLILAAGLGLRLAYGLARPMGERAQPDPDSYIALARSFAEGWTLALEEGPSAHREPGYPLAVGLLMKVLGTGWGAVLSANLLFSVLALWALFGVAEGWYGRQVALLALCLAAAYPPFVYYANQGLRESLVTLLSVFSILALSEAYRRGKAAAFAGAGAAGAALALTSSTYLPFAGAAPFLLFLFPEIRFRRALNWSAAYLAVFVALYSLWPLRNYSQFGRLVVGSTLGGGGSFYAFVAVPQELGGSPEASEALARDPVVKEAKDLDAISRDKHFWKAGAAVIRQDPGRYVRLVAWRLFRDQWRVVPRPRAYEHGYRLLWWISLLTDGWIIPLGFVGIALARLKTAEAAWAYWLIASVSLIYALIFTMLRYRLPLMPWMILFSAYALNQGRTFLRRH